MPTTAISTPAICCSSAFHAAKQPWLLLNVVSHACWSWLRSGNGQAISRGFVKPQQLKASWMALIAFGSLLLNMSCQRPRSPQSKPEGGAACVPSRVMTTVE
jgi:hypothetical protein